MKRVQHLLAVALCLLVAGCAHTPKSRAAFNQLIQRPRVPLHPILTDVPNTNGLVQLRFSIATEAGQRIPGFLLKQPDASSRRPVVIALHGTGSSKANLLALGRKLATNGFVAVVMDGRHHGERISSGKGMEEYFSAIARAWETGGAHPLYYDTVWDVQRLVDYLQTRPDVDARRIGLFGISKGGIETYLAAAVDRRIAVAVPCLGVQSFDWALKNGAWPGRIKTIQPAFDAVVQKSGGTNSGIAFVQEFYDRVVPGISAQFDGPAMVPLIAPRPLLVINSDSDPNTPLPGVMECAAATRAAYQKKKAEDRFVLRIQEKTAHQLRPESERAAIEWFVRWLRP